MIRVILQGRTGNNLFQYSAGRHVASLLGVELMLDGSWSNKALASQFRHLFRLPVKASFHRRASILKRGGRRFNLWDESRLHYGPVIRDCDLVGPEDLNKVEDGSLLIGFFQRPMLFESIQSIIRNDLDLEQIELDAESLRFEEKIKSQLTISIHIRRGDYTRIENTKSIGVGYFDQAVTFFRERHEGVRFCIFSNDIPWCQKKYGNNYEYCDLSQGKSDPLHDMRLMASCEHNIIANSSYSWWAAWLNKNESKQVIAPSRWMLNAEFDPIVPESWVRM